MDSIFSSDHIGKEIRARVGERFNAFRDELIFNWVAWQEATERNRNCRLTWDHEPTHAYRTRLKELYGEVGVQARQLEWDPHARTLRVNFHRVSADQRLALSELASLPTSGLRVQQRYLPKATKEMLHQKRLLADLRFNLYQLQLASGGHQV